MSHKINPSVTEMQKQIIMGTILGGSSIVRSANGVNSYLSMRGKEAAWLEYKAMQLSNLASVDPFTADTTRRWHSMCYPIFNNFRNDFYDNNGKRRLKNDSLDGLKDVAFSIWYGDCGKHDKYGHVSLNTHVWGEKNTKIIVKYLRAVGFESEIVLDRNCYRIALNKESSKNFFILIEPQLPHWFF